MQRQLHFSAAVAVNKFFYAWTLNLMHQSNQYIFAEKYFRYASYIIYFQTKILFQEIKYFTWENIYHLNTDW